MLLTNTKIHLLGKCSFNWERPTKRAITAIIMHSDKTSLTEAVVSQVKNQMIIEAYGDLLESNML
jgi:hypothetical protein